MKKFDTQMKLYVLDNRKAGVGWKAIIQNFKQKFDIDPPTIRAMQKWEKMLDRSVLTAQLMKDVKIQMPEVEADVTLEVAKGLMPVLWKAKDAGEDVVIAGWKWFLSLVEAQLGKENFLRVINEYLKEQKSK